jgi:aminomuconate-semialdehyde/2-hydroxymuconate-6-semialdehyde dehydrogenase
MKYLQNSTKNKSIMHILNYINGTMQAALSGDTLDNFEPATGHVYGQIADSDSADVAMAFEAAKAAKESWAHTPAEEKFKWLNALADAIDADRERFAAAESKDQGKPLWLARNEMIRAAQNFRFFATAAMQFASESHATENKAINYTLRQPIGVVGCISPWNLPLYLFSWKIAPALAAGNTVIAKPSEFTAATAHLLGEACIKIGFPVGVLNIVNGLGPKVGQAMVEHKGIKAISFTGGTATGKHIASIAAPMFKKLSLELGGKNPNIIFEDADIEKAMKTTINTSFLNQGEICLCGSRLMVHESIYEVVKNRIVHEANNLKVGNPKEENTRVGAIVSQQHYDKVLAHIELAKEEGGTILAGGTPVFPEGFESGWFIAPTVIEGLSATCRTNTEEIFGPVITLIPFKDEEEALTIANATDYGLAATLWTENLTRAHRMAANLEFGIVWINCWLLRDLRTPFGGAKSSGVGREGGWEAMRFFTEPKNVCIALS